MGSVKGLFGWGWEFGVWTTGWLREVSHHLMGDRHLPVCDIYCKTGLLLGPTRIFDWQPVLV